MSDQTFILKELPLKQLQLDAKQPRKDYGVDGDENRLFVSMRDVGIQQPLVVKAVDKDLYTIIDGHRRYICAQRLGLETVPCRVYTKLGAGELERVRFEVQNNRREWKPMERAEAISQAKTAKRLDTDREVAEYLHVAPSTINSALSLRTQHMDYISLMEKYQLPETYRVEIGRLISKVRKIRDLEPNPIIVILFDKVQRKAIKNAKDFRVLKRIFLRATANEDPLYRFLKDPMMTIAELERITSQSATALLIDRLFSDLGSQAQRGEKIAPQEKALYTQLRDLLTHMVSA